MNHHAARLTALTAVFVLTAALLPRMSAAAAGTTLTVGKNGTYQTVGEALQAAAARKPAGETERITVAIEPGTYREQLLINTPYLTFVNSNPNAGEVRLTWYYGIGYQYYSAAGSGYYSAEDARSKSAKGAPQRWGTAVRIQKDAAYFRAENITFENSFNRYMTNEEIADGVEVSGKEKITYQRRMGADVTCKQATERAAALCVEAERCEFSHCKFYGSQDTLYTEKQAYFRECLIQGNTDYIFGSGDVVFDACELRFAGYSDNAVGGYITAARQQSKGYLFWNCTVTGNPELRVGTGYFGRPWRDTAHVLFYQTTLQNGNLIQPAGWTSMSGVDPSQATFREYHTVLADGSGVNTGSRTPGTVLSSCDVTREDYFGGWVPYYLGGTGVTAVNIPTEECYRLRNAGSGLYLTAAGDAAVQETSGSVWQLDNAGSGYYRLKDTVSGMYLDVTGGKADNGTIVGMYGESGSDAQLFKFTAADSGYVMRTKVSEDKSCVGIAEGSANTGARTVEWECIDAADQQWELEVAIVPIGGRLLRDITVFDRENAADWSVAEDAANGKPIFGDRAVVFQNLPAELTGAEYIRTACDSKRWEDTLAEMTAAEPVTAYIAMDSRVEPLPEWLSDWTRTALEFDNDDSVHFICYARELAAGDTVTLGRNGKKDYAVNYVVLAVPRAAETTTVTTTATASFTTTTAAATTTAGETTATTETVLLPVGMRGDVNCDAAVDVKDAVLLARFVGNDAVTLSKQGTANAELDGESGLSVRDLTLLLQGIAHIIAL